MTLIMSMDIRSYDTHHVNGLHAILHQNPAEKNICITFVQCWTNVEDVGPTLYKCCTNSLCLLGNNDLHYVNGLHAMLHYNAANTKHLYNICTMLANVEDVGLTLYKCCTNVLCLLGNNDLHYVNGLHAM